MVLFIRTIDEWYSNIVDFLTYGKFPDHLMPKEKRRVNIKSIFFFLWDNGLYKWSLDGTFLHFVDKEKRNKLLESYHNLACGGNFSTLITDQKILRDKYYWPTLV